MEEVQQIAAIDLAPLRIIGAGLVVIGAGIGIGLVGQGATTGLARNPEVQPKLMVFMILGMALAESIAIYGLVISLILLYANPLLK